MKSFWAVVLLGLTFFCFVDDKYRGWEDTNQYQAEAKVWSQGGRPPLKEMSANHSSVEYPLYYPVLVPYVWSFVSNARDWRASLVRIKIIQATFLFLTILMTFKILGADLSALIIIVLFFLNAFFREAIVTPISEIQCLFILTLSYFLPAGTGVLFVLQALTRSVVGVLHLGVLWKKRKSVFEICSGVAAAIVGVLYFRSLALGPKMNAVDFRSSALNTLMSLKFDLSWFLFPHLPYNSPIFQMLWGVFLLIASALILRRLAKGPKVFFIGCLVYFFVILNVPRQGARYFVPLFLALLLEFKPRIPKRWIYRAPLFLLASHLVFQQVEGIRLFRLDRTPETDTPGLVATHDWIKQNPKLVQNVMMKRFRYCFNYFGIQCYNYPERMSDLQNELRSKSVDHVIFSGTTWQGEERDFKVLLQGLFQARHLDYSKSVSMFQNVEVVDVRGLLQ